MGSAVGRQWRDAQKLASSLSSLINPTVSISWLFAFLFSLFSSFPFIHATIIVLSILVFFFQYLHNSRPVVLFGGTHYVEKTQHRRKRRRRRRPKWLPHFFTVSLSCLRLTHYLFHCVFQWELPGSFLCLVVYLTLWEIIGGKMLFSFSFCMFAVCKRNSCMNSWTPFADPCNFQFSFVGFSWNFMNVTASWFMCFGCWLWTFFILW